MIRFRFFATRRACFLSVQMMALILLCGCSSGINTDYTNLNLATVSGTVTLDEEPLFGALVTFEAPDQTYSYGITDATGSYSLMFNSEQEGVTPGEKIIRITIGTAADETDDADETGNGNETADGDEQLPEVNFSIPARYNSESELTQVVKTGSQTIDFNLVSAP